MVGKHSKKKRSKHDVEEPKELTPWQIENIRYQEELAAQKLAEEEALKNAEFGEQEDSLVSDATFEIDHDIEEYVDETVAETPIEKWEVTEEGHKTFKLSTESELDEEIDESVKKLKDLPKSVSFADKLPKMKETRHKRLRRRLILIISIFAVVALALFYYISPLSKVGEIKVVGNDKVASERVVSSLGVSDKDFIWQAYFDKGMLKKAKKENQRINTIDRKLVGVNGLKLIVTEFAEVAYVKDGENLFAVLENGTIIKENVSKPDNKFPLMVGFKEDDVLKAFVEKFYIVSKEVRKNIKEIHATPSKTNPYLITIYMEDGNEILASTRDYYEKINYYPSVAKQMDGPGVVDMEAGVFSKSYVTIAAEEAEKKAKEEEEKIAKGELAGPSNDSAKDQAKKENGANGMGYDKWLESLQDGELEESWNQTPDNPTEDDASLDEQLTGGMDEDVYDPNLDPNLDPNYDPNLDPNYDPNAVPQYDENGQPIGDSNAGWM